MDRQLMPGEARERQWTKSSRLASSSMKNDCRTTAWEMPRAVGNSGMLLQPKLTIGAPNDRYEQEADRVADAVVRGGGGSAALSDSAGAVRRTCTACGGGGAPCPKCEEEQVQRMPVAGSITPLVQRESMPEEEDDEVQRKPVAGSITPLVQREAAPEEEEEMVQSKHAQGGATQSAGAPMTSRQEGMVTALRGGGAPMSPSVRAYMEPRFGHDFSGVRVHTDDRAAESARSIGALAYTIGHDVVFGSGMYTPDTREGKRLLAHELTHVVQQGASPETGTARAFPSPRPAPSSGPVISRARRIAAAARVSRVPSPMLQRQQPPANLPCPSVVTVSPADPLHVPACGTTVPRAAADVGNVAWSLAPDPTAVDPGTTIAADGRITIAAAQAAGTLRAVATVTQPDTSTCDAFQQFNIRSHPTGISNTTFLAMAPGGGTHYGGTFNHTFISNDGNVASLLGVRVGERFIGIPNPTAATHNIVSPTWPFGGTFTLSTAQLNPNANGAWDLTSAGEFSTHDSITTERANINVGRFIVSTSRPTLPNGALPATMTLTQGLHWHCTTQTTNNGWTAAPFIRVAHSRTLRASSGAVEFVTTVNGLELVETYSGPTGVFNVTASPVSTPASAPGAVPPGTPPPTTPGTGGTGGTTAPPPPVARTVRITCDTLPAQVASTALLAFSIQGNALGCTITPDATDNHAATVVIGSTAGTITVRVADATNTNFSDVSIVIT